MRNILLSIILSFAMSCFSQTREYYVDIMVFGRTEGSLLNGKYAASIDVGTNEEGCIATLCREDSSYVFETEMSIINYMADRGWQLIDFEDTPLPGSSSVIAEVLAGRDIAEKIRISHYIMKKCATSLQNALNGLVLMKFEQAKRIMKSKKRAKRIEERNKNTDDMYY